ncbi:MAG TPA: hypothetical protein VN366_01800 [Feifaniaceae bacterium]|nr:hypothetical protein [Feifaniaceae bacterium]
MQKVRIFGTAAIFVALAAAYGYWAFTEPSITAASAVAAAVLTALFGFLCAQCLRGLIGAFSGGPEPALDAGLGRRSLRRAYRHPVVRLFLLLLLARVAVYIAAYAVFTLKNGYPGGLVDTLSLWNFGDVPHYLGIADNWYATEGDARFHIVFFPLYPIVVRLLSELTQNTFAAGLIVSLLSTAAAGVLLYELALMDMDRAAAMRTVTLQMLLPAAFLFNAPMSDGLFLLLSLAVMLLVRKKQYWTACVLGALASFTRVLGLILLVPVAVELIGDAVRHKKETGRWAGFFLLRAPALLLIPLGFCAYLAVNKSVTGDAFMFLKYQSEHWNQKLGWFFHTASYQTNEFIATLSTWREAALGLWLPNLLSLFGAPLIMVLALLEKRQPQQTEESAEGPAAPLRRPYALRPSYVAYFAAYYFVSMGTTWLLSAPRYLAACFPVAFALNRLVTPRNAWAAYSVLGLFQLLYLYAYVAQWPVY